MNYRLAEINKLGGTLSAKLERYKEEREKITADQNTIRDAGADGVCPLCRQKLGKHFGSIEAEFNARLQDLEGKAIADLERQEKLAKEKAVIEALKPALDAVSTLDAKLRQKPVYEEELASLEGNLKKKAEEEKAISGSLTNLAFNEDTFKACEQENAELQNVQRRILELGTKIGEAVTSRQHLADLTAKIAGRKAELARLGWEIKAAAFDPAEVAQPRRNHRRD